MDSDECFKECEGIIRDGNVEEDEKVELLGPILDSNPGLTHVFDESGETLLHIAIGARSKKVVRFLLDHGSNVNAVRREERSYFDSDQDTPLTLATKRNDVEIMRLLLCYHADINRMDRREFKPVTIAVKGGNLEAVRLLLTYGACVDEIHHSYQPLIVIASKNGNLEMLRILLDCNARVSYLVKYMDFGHHIYSWDLNPNHPQYTNIAKLLIEHRIIQSPDALDELLEVSDGRMLLNNEALSNHSNMCRIEIGYTKKQKIGNSEVSFYDFLAADKNKLLAYLNDQNIVLGLGTFNYEEKFPIYAKEINRKCRIREKMGNSTISLCAFLTADENMLAIYLSNNDVVQWLSSYDYEREFSVYAGEIRSLYQKGMERKILMDTAHLVMQHSDMRALNSVYTEFTKHLTNHDLRIIKEAAVSVCNDNKDTGNNAVARDSSSKLSAVNITQAVNEPGNVQKSVSNRKKSNKLI